MPFTLRPQHSSHHVITPHRVERSFFYKGRTLGTEAVAIPHLNTGSALETATLKFLRLLARQTLNLPLYGIPPFSSYPNMAGNILWNYVLLLRTLGLISSNQRDEFVANNICEPERYYRVKFARFIEHVSVKSVVYPFFERLRICLA